MVRLGEVIHDTVDVRLDVLRALDVEMPVRTDMQRVGDAEVVPEKLVERRVFVDPDDLIDRYNGIAVHRGLDEEMFCDKHILRCKLRQRRKFILCLLQKLFRIAEQREILARGRENWKADIEDEKYNADQGIAAGRKKYDVEQRVSEQIVIRLTQYILGDFVVNAVFGPVQIRSEMI